MIDTSERFSGTAAGALHLALHRATLQGLAPVLNERIDITNISERIVGTFYTGQSA
ncbi:MAG TPA: hypothetical protein V6C89_20675 [Drouetiella sp.]|jgi:hypothetical protein